jgi:hypothetical protein
LFRASFCSCCLRHVAYHIWCDQEEFTDLWTNGAWDCVPTVVEKKIICMRATRKLQCDLRSRQGSEMFPFRFFMRRENQKRMESSEHFDG